MINTNVDDAKERATRRDVLTQGLTGATTTLLLPSSSSQAAKDDNANTTTIVPLEYIPSLRAFVLHFYLFGEPFSAIVDTGSPFLTVPSTCNKFAYKHLWGCYHPERTCDSGYANTVEGFNSNTGTVVWRKAGFAWDPQDPPHDLVFGVLGPELLDGPGGVFLGLIRDTAKWIRPSFVGQTLYTSFCVDLRPNQRQLVLSQHPMIHRGDFIPLTNDLVRKYQAPVLHYTAKAARFVVNGLPLQLNDRKRPTYVIFDTGVSGMVVSQELFDGRYLQARKNKEKSLWGHVQVSFRTEEGNEVTLTATQPVTTPLGLATPFRRFQGNLIVIGLAFLDGKAMTIDIDQGKLQFGRFRGRRFVPNTWP